MRDVMYFKKVNDIGGVESFTYYLSKKYNFEFYYKEGKPGFEEQIKRLAMNIKVRKYKKGFECDRLYVNYNPDILKEIKAKEKIGLIHCDYSGVSLNPIISDEFTNYIGVSQYVCDVFTNLTGLKSELCYNPVFLKKPNVKKKKGLHIIYAGRLSEEKQGWLIDKFAEKMDKYIGIYYDTWDLTVYTNRNVKFSSKNVYVKPPKLDLTREMAEATFTLITSKHEAFCLSAVESLCLGTPLICTDLPVFKELGINDKNSIKIDETLNDFNPQDLLKKFVFVYNPPKDNWGKWLEEKNGQYDPYEKVEVKVLKNKLWLVEEDIHLKKGDTYNLPQCRASYLEAKNYVEIVDNNTLL